MALKAMHEVDRSRPARRRGRALLVAVAVAVAVSLALAACGGNGGDASPTTEETAPAEPTTEAAAPESLRIPPGGGIPPGTYEADPFEPALRLTFDEPGWRALFAPEDDELAFEHDDGRLLVFSQVKRVVDPESGADVPAPEDLVQWLREHPALQPTQDAPVSVGGESGTRVDATPPQSETEIFWYPAGALRAVPQLRWRVIHLDAGGTPLTIVIGIPKESFEQGLTKLEPLLASIQFA